MPGRRVVAAAIALALVIPGTIRAQADSAAGLEAMRRADLLLASIGFRLSVAAAPLCTHREPGTGLQLHTLAQYAPPMREVVRAHFRFHGSVGVEGVVPGSPAERAGVREDDSVSRIGPIAVSQAVPGEATTAILAQLHAALAALPPAEPIEVALHRDGRVHRIRIAPLPACRTRYELQIAEGFDARANGDLVQISSKYLEEVDPALLPALVAHELAHNILGHRERLEAAGAEFGLASGFGRNVGLFRQTEIEADILSVHLLARAGYDPGIAARFWREVGPRVLEGKIRSRSHPPFRDRAATVEAEASRIAAQGKDAPLPAFFATRDRPLDGKWEDLLVRARR